MPSAKYRRPTFLNCHIFCRLGKIPHIAGTMCVILNRTKTELKPKKMSKCIILFILFPLILSCKQDKDNTGNLKKIQYFKTDAVGPSVGTMKNITLEARENKISLDTLIPKMFRKIQL